MGLKDYMITFATSQEDIDAVPLEPKSLYAALDDFSEKIIYRPDFTYLVINNNGIVMLERMNTICYIIHMVFNRKLFGSVEEIIREILREVFSNSPCQKMLTLVPSYNRLAYSLTKRLGGKEEGVLSESFSKGYKLYDQTIFGMTKSEFEATAEVM